MYNKVSSNGRPWTIHPPTHQCGQRTGISDHARGWHGQFSPEVPSNENPKFQYPSKVLKPLRHLVSHHGCTHTVY